MDIKGRFLEFINYKGLSKRKFQESIGVSNSYIQNISNGIGADVLQRIKAAYPELNTDWLLDGTGEMLNKGITQNANGDNNTQIAGNSNQVNNSSTLDKAISEIAEQRKLVAKSQEQIDRLLAVIEHLTSSK